MILPIKKVYDILLNSGSFLALLPAEKIFMMEVPEDYRTGGKAPILRITEVNESQNNHASNKPTAILFSFQIDIWEKDLQKIGEMKNELDQILNNINLTRTYGIVIKDEDLTDTFRLITRFSGSEQIKFN